MKLFNLKVLLPLLLAVTFAVPSHLLAGGLIEFDNPIVGQAPIVLHLPSDTLTIKTPPDMNQTILQSVRDEFNAIAGSTLRLNMNFGAAPLCTQAVLAQAKEALQTTPGTYLMLYCSPEIIDEVYDITGLLGFTDFGLDDSGLIKSVLVVVRNDMDEIFEPGPVGIGGEDYTIEDYIRLVIAHELGHAVGLDHTAVFSAPTYDVTDPFPYGSDPTVMYPGVFKPAKKLTDDDINGILNLYAARPGDPLSFYNSKGACVRGRILDQSGKPMNGVLVTAFDNFESDGPYLSTGTSMGRAPNGIANAKGEYTLCGPHDRIKYLRVELCDVNGITCGVDAAGSGLFSFLTIDYQKTGGKFIYTGRSTWPKPYNPENPGNDFGCAEKLNLAAGQILEGVNFYIDPFWTSEDTGLCTSPVDTTPPPIPTYLLANVVHGSSPLLLRIAWFGQNDPGSSTTGFELSVNGVNLPDIASYADSFKLLPVEHGKTYVVKVRALNGAGMRSAWSLPLSMTVDATPPPTPKNLTVIVGPDNLSTPGNEGTTNLTVTWDAVVDPESGPATSYLIWNSLQPNVNPEITKIVTDKTSYVFSGLTPDTNYSFAVTAVNSFGFRSEATAYVSAFTDSTMVDATPPTLPGKPRAIGTNPTAILVMWDASVDAESSRINYEIRINGNIIRATSSLFYRDTDLPPGTVRTYEIRARNASGRLSAWTPGVTAKAQPIVNSTTPPPIPGNLFVLPGPNDPLTSTDERQNTLTISWNPVETPTANFVHYRVRINGGTSRTTRFPSYRDTGLAPGVSRRYEVSAFDNATGLLSPWSLPIDAAPLTASPADQTPPTVPSGLRASYLYTSGTRTVYLFWNASTDVETQVQRYQVRIDGNDSSFFTTTTTATFLRETGLPMAARRSYEVRALNGANGSSNWSPAFIAVTPGPDLTPPTIPAYVYASTSYATYILVSWTASTDAQSLVSEYKVRLNGDDRQIFSAGSNQYYYHRNLLSGVSHCYEIKAINAEGAASTWSSKVCGKTTF